MQSTPNPTAPSLGRIVLVRGMPVDPSAPRREVPAIITRICDHTFVDLMVFAMLPQPFQFSVQFHSNTDIDHDRIVWRWPPFVPAAINMSDLKIVPHGDITQASVNEPDAKPAAAGLSVLDQSPNAPTFLERVIEELHALNNRRQKLMIFVGTDMFLDLHKEQRELLHKQGDIMADYADVLSKRIRLAQAG